VDERRLDGRGRRRTTPLATHHHLELSDERDPIAVLEGQSATRLAELVPVRYDRMLKTPLAFYRGAAAVMASDLAATPVAGLQVQLCGDAHLANFGGYASPERALVFDANDFDETLPGPFEWDVKRLATSFELAARERGFPVATREVAVRRVARSYRQAMREFAKRGNLATWYARLDADSLLADLAKLHDQRFRSHVARTAAKAKQRDSLRAFAQLTNEVGGEPRIISKPPLIVPLSELTDGSITASQLEGALLELFRGYRRSLPTDRRRLLESFRYVDLARRVVGVGSVGTRCWILLLVGRDAQDPLFLQVKEANRSVYEPLLGASGYANHGQRVVEGQRLMQAYSDIFLGWIRSDVEPGETRDFYVRQLCDWKASIHIDAVLPEGLELYARACGWTLARGHARSGDAVAIAAYLGKGDDFDRAIVRFGAAYADVTERDHGSLVEAVNMGRVRAVAAP
jgi:uncharacterized protein (DUF2252 family)